MLGTFPHFIPSNPHNKIARLTKKKKTELKLRELNMLLKIYRPLKDRT